MSIVMLVTYPSDEAVEAWFAAHGDRLRTTPPEVFDELAVWIPVVDLPVNDNLRPGPVGVPSAR